MPCCLELAIRDRRRLVPGVFDHGSRRIDADNKPGGTDGSGDGSREVARPTTHIENALPWPNAGSDDKRLVAAAPPAEEEEFDREVIHTRRAKNVTVARCWVPLPVYQRMHQALKLSRLRDDARQVPKE